MLPPNVNEVGFEMASPQPAFIKSNRLNKTLENEPQAKVTNASIILVRSVRFCLLNSVRASHNLLPTWFYPAGGGALRGGGIRHSVPGGAGTTPGYFSSRAPPDGFNQVISKYWRLVRLTSKPGTTPTFSVTHLWREEVETDVKKSILEGDNVKKSTPPPLIKCIKLTTVAANPVGLS